MKYEAEETRPNYMKAVLLETAYIPPTVVELQQHQQMHPPIPAKRPASTPIGEDYEAKRRRVMEECIPDDITDFIFECNERQHVASPLSATDQPQDDQVSWLCTRGKPRTSLNAWTYGGDDFEMPKWVELMATELKKEAEGIRLSEIPKLDEQRSLSSQETHQTAVARVPIVVANNSRQRPVGQASPCHAPSVTACKASASAPQLPKLKRPVTVNGRHSSPSLQPGCSGWKRTLRSLRSQETHQTAVARVPESATHKSRQGPVGQMSLCHSPLVIACKASSSTPQQLQIVRPVTVTGRHSSPSLQPGCSGWKRPPRSLCSQETHQTAVARVPIVVANNSRQGPVGQASPCHAPSVTACKATSSAPQQPQLGRPVTVNGRHSSPSLQPGCSGWKRPPRTLISQETHQRAVARVPGVAANDSRQGLVGQVSPRHAPLVAVVCKASSSTPQKPQLGRPVTVTGRHSSPSLQPGCSGWKRPSRSLCIQETHQMAVVRVPAAAANDSRQGPVGHVSPYHAPLVAVCKTSSSTPQQPQLQRRVNVIGIHNSLSPQPRCSDWEGLPPQADRPNYTRKVAMAVAVRIVELLALVAVVALLVATALVALVLEQLLGVAMILLRPGCMLATSTYYSAESTVLSAMQLPFQAADLVAQLFWPEAEPTEVQDILSEME